MVIPTKRSLQYQYGEGTSSSRFSTNAEEELGPFNNSEEHIVPEESQSSAGNQNGPGGNGDQSVELTATTAKALGKRKLLHPTDDHINLREVTQLEANQGEGLANPKKKRCMNLPAYDSKIDKAPAYYNIESIAELVRLAAEELKVMAVVTEPLWRYCPSADDGTIFLDKVAYRSMFRNLVGPTQVGFSSEASRENVRVKLSPKHLVSIMMDVSKWSVMFSAIVAKARTIEVLMNPGGATDYDGTLQVMAARYHFSTPLVPNRETYFARYCKKYSETDWIVVDVSLDRVHQLPVMNCRRRPSGCLIHGLSNGFSQIAWVEHVDADYRDVSTVYQSLLFSGIGFGAKRWISTLDRRCQQLGTNTSMKVPLRNNQQLMSSDRKSWIVLLKLAARMVYHFNSGISGSTGNWQKLSGHSTDNIRIMIRRTMDDPSLPRGTLVSATSSFWLPMSPKSVFAFLHDYNSGTEPLIPYTGREWELLSRENVTEEMCHISSGEEASHCVSLHKVLAEDSSQETVLLLQESCNDPLDSYIVYSRLGTEKDLNQILSRSNAEYPRILPSGYSVLPDSPASGKEGASGSFLTISFQLLLNSSPTFVVPAGMHSTVTDLINCTTERVKVALEEYVSQVALFASME